MEQTIDLIIVFNVICLIGLVVGIKRWGKKHGAPTEKWFAVILNGYFSLSFITTSLPLLIVFPKVIFMDIIFLLLLWGIGYPWIRWLYRQFACSKKN